MIIITDTLVVNTDHLLWFRKEKEERWVLVFKGTGVSTTNITDPEAQALKAELLRVQSIRPNATEPPPAVRPGPKKPPEKP